MSTKRIKTSNTMFPNLFYIIIERERTLLKPVYKARIILTPKLDEDTTKIE